MLSRKEFRRFGMVSSSVRKLFICWISRSSDAVSPSRPLFLWLCISLYVCRISSRSPVIVSFREGISLAR